MQTQTSLRQTIKTALNGAMGFQLETLLLAHIRDFIAHKFLVAYLQATDKDELKKLERLFNSIVEDGNADG